MLQFSVLAQETATAQRLSQADLAATLQRGVASLAGLQNRMRLRRKVRISNPL
jgi:hypothetical protein